MIITRLSARNVLKYAKLELSDVPSEGIIGIQGPNEAGKSSIGETICLALFGRTFSLSPNEIRKVVRWGADQCSVTLGFRIGGDEYEIARFLDDEGHHSARLGRPGEEEPVARGVEGVEEAVRRLLGYGFGEFIESFYLAQREISTPHPHSQAVKVMAGVAPLEKAAQEFEDDVELVVDEIDVLEGDRAKVAAEYDALGLEPGYVDRLRNEQQSLRDTAERLSTQVGELESNASDYQDLLPRMARAQSSRGSASFFRYLFLLVALVAAGVWGYLASTPNAELSPGLLGWLNQSLPGWESKISWLLYGAGAAGLIWVLFWTRLASVNTQIQQLLQESGEIADRFEHTHEVLSSMGSTGEASTAAVGEEADAGGPLTDDEAAEVRVQMAEMSASAAEVLDVATRDGAWARARIEGLRAEVDALEGQIEEENERLRKGANLKEEVGIWEEQIERRRQHVKLRKNAMDLLERSTRHISQRFNRRLKELVGDTLPLFTDGRYEHLQIDENLAVRVFSRDKHDFMDLDEISSGTQRQIMLAVRLALSEELADKTAEGDQMLILDEPFAFFDDERTRNALSVLPKFSDSINQIWVIGQKFPPDWSFAMEIRCSRDSSEQGAGDPLDG